VKLNQNVFDQISGFRIGWFFNIFFLHRMIKLNLGSIKILKIGKKLKRIFILYICQLDMIHSDCEAIHYSFEFEDCTISIQQGCLTGRLIITEILIF